MTLKKIAGITIPKEWILHFNPTCTEYWNPTCRTIKPYHIADSLIAIDRSDGLEIEIDKVLENPFFYCDEK